MSEGTRRRYPSDMSDAEWGQLAPLIPPKVGKGKNRTVNLREVMNAPFSGKKTLCTSCEPVVRGNICREIFLRRIPFITTSPSGRRMERSTPCWRRFMKNFA